MPSDYQRGVGDSLYKKVPRSYRAIALSTSKRARTKAKIKQPKAQMTKDLLDGFTLFAYDPFMEEGHRKAHGQLFQTLYNTARRHGKTFRCVGYDLIEEDKYRGYIMWMEDDEESQKVNKQVERYLREIETIHIGKKAM